MIELSSDTDEKFSRHLIIRLPGHAFEDNASVGSFINRIMARPEVCSYLTSFHNMLQDVNGSII